MLHPLLSTVKEPEDDRFYKRFALCVLSGFGVAGMQMTMHGRFDDTTLQTGILTGIFTAVAGIAGSKIPKLKHNFFRPVCAGTLNAQRANAWNLGALAGAAACLSVMFATVSPVQTEKSAVQPAQSFEIPHYLVRKQLTNDASYLAGPR